MVCIKKSIFLILFLLNTSYFLLHTSYSAYSLSSKTDSLLKIVQTLQKKSQRTYTLDTTLVNSLNLLAWELRNRNPDTSIILSTRAKLKAENINYDLGIGQANLNLGWFNYLKTNFTKALAHYKIALSVWEKMEKNPEVKDKSIILQKRASTFGNLGSVFRNQSQNIKALDYYFKALKIDEELGNKKREALWLNNIGVIYTDQAIYTKALECYFKALKIAEQSGDKNGIADYLSNIGNIYHNKSDCPKALEYYFSALKIKEELGDKYGIANNLGNIGLVYSIQHEYQKALEYLLKELKIKEYLGDGYGVASNLGNMGIIYSSLKEYSKALEYYFRALKIKEEIGDEKGMAATLGNIGTIYSIKGEYEKAEEYLQKAKLLCDSIGALRINEQIENSYSNLDGFRGNFKGSLEHYKKYIAARDSIFNEENEKKQTRLEVKYEFEKEQILKEQNEKEKARKSTETRHRRDNLQYSLILIGMFVLITMLLLLGRLKVNYRIVAGLIFIVFLIFFEFILVFIDPFIDTWTGGAPGWKLSINAVIAAIIYPVHTLFENFIKRKLLIAKNEKSINVTNASDTENLIGNSSVTGNPTMKFIFFMGLMMIFFINAGNNKTEEKNSTSTLYYDSLNSILNSTNEMNVMDTSYIFKLNSLAWKLSKNNPDTAILLSTMALKLAEKFNYTLGIGVSNQNLGAFNRLISNYTLALEYFENGIHAWEKLEKNVNQDAQKSGNLIIMDVKLKKANALSNMGNVYLAQSDFPKALEIYFMSLKISEEFNDKKGITTCSGNIGIVYASQKDYSKALDYFLMALKTAEETGDNAKISNNLINIGNIYTAKREYAEALKYFFRVQNIKESHKDKAGLARILGNIGLVYYQKSDYPNALNYLLKALKIKEELGDKYGMAINFGNLGMLYVHSPSLPSPPGEKKKGYALAEKFIQKAIFIGDSIGAVTIKSEYEKSYSELDSARGNFKGSLEHYKKYINARDIIYNEENEKKQTRTEAKYEFEKARIRKEQNEKEAVRIEKEMRERRDHLQYSVIAFGLILLFISLIFVGRMKINPKITEGLIFINFLIFFEFILVLSDPFLDSITGGAPGLKLLVNATIAGLIFPLHALMENLVKGRILGN